MILKKKEKIEMHSTSLSPTLDGSPAWLSGRSHAYNAEMVLKDVWRARAWVRRTKMGLKGLRMGTIHLSSFSARAGSH